MFCTACGTKALAADKFCMRCGHPLRAIHDITPRATRTRPTFGETIRPISEAVSEPKTQPAPASQTVRLINLLLDYAGVWVFAFIVLAAVAFTLSLTGQFNQALWEASLQGWPSYVLTLMLFFAYYLLFETLFGRTPAKLITRTRVISNADGKRPGFLAIAKRSAVRLLLPVEAFSFFGSRAPRGWHDTLSGTAVVKNR